MAAFVVVVILLLVGVWFLVRGVAVGKDTHRRALRWPGAVVVLLAVVVSGFAFTYHTDAKDVSVITSFGKPVGQSGPGLHLKAPWQKTTQIDGTTQVDEYSGGNCLPVRIGDGSESCLSATVRWHINLEEADNIYSSYRSNDPTGVLRSAVVDTQFKAAAQDVLSKYNPVAGLQVIEGTDAGAATQINFNPDYDQTSKDLTAQMAERLGADPTVVIDSITVSGLSLAESTQDTLNKFIAAVGQTRVAAQDKVTKAQEALGNKALAAQKLTPEILASKCYDTVVQAIQAGYQLPAGFSCVGSSAVVIPATGGSTGGSTSNDQAPVH